MFLPMKKGKKKLNKNRSRSAGPDALGKLTRVRQKWALLGLLLLINLMAYSNSFTTGWHFDDLSNIEENLHGIIIFEIKSTRKPLKPDFSTFFFSLTGAEVLVAQSLKKQFKFALVNTTTTEHLELGLAEIFARAKGIYSGWSIML